VREEWSQNTWVDIAWKSFTIAFNKTPTARQPTLTKLSSLWCTDIQHRRNEERILQCCFCEHDDEDWKHILTCPGAGETINRNESFDSLKLEQKQFDVQEEIWAAIEHGVSFFNIHQERKDTPRHITPFPRTLQPRDILLNDAFAAQSKIGWGNFLKGIITQKWSKLLRPKRKQDMREAYEQSLIKAIWQHSVRQWDFINEESQKDETRSVAEYKQHAPCKYIRTTYQDKYNLAHPLNPLQEQQFQILIDDLLLMSYNIRKAWLRSSEIYILRAKAHHALYRGTEGSLLYSTQQNALLTLQRSNKFNFFFYFSRTP
jgi:hypothetical protein